MRWCAAVVLAAGITAAAPAMSRDAELAQQALELVNRARAEHGLQPLVLKRPLIDAAAYHARDMKRREYFGHVSPQGMTAFQRYLKAGGSRWHAVAENIAHCPECGTQASPDLLARMHDGWMDSPGHRRNILLPSANAFGFASVGGRSGIYAVQTFAGTGTPRGVATGTQSRTIAPGDPVLLPMEDINGRRHREGAPGLQRSADLSRMAGTALGIAGPLAFAGDGLAVLSDAAEGLHRKEWSVLASVAGSCGACGPDVVETDAEVFLKDWMENPKYRKVLINAAFDRIGLAIAANGEGGKLALALLGRR